MKKRIIAGLSLSTILAFSLVVFLSSKEKENVKVEGYNAQSSLPTTIDLNDTSAANIRSYYSSLNNLSTSERQGTNLLKNLKTILKNGQKYYTYDSGSAIWQIYEIADRDWDKSPASSTTYGTYNSSTNKITGYTYGTSTSNGKNNPYVHALYFNRNITNQVRAWDDHQQDEWGINREHVWAKAEGFENSGAGGARGDPMHLMAGAGYSNNIHSNYFYGYVNTSSSYTNCGTKYSNQTGNLMGKSKTLGGSTSVFEPQDSDKGDIARAIFYMVARYNYLSGSDSDGIDSNNPNLTLTQSLSDWASSGYESTTSNPGKMGILTDLLAWHHADPVDEYEIHRNNLLYTNYTNNRNPFIDFPEWVDFIWGTASYNGSSYQSYSSAPTGYATPSSDTINGYNSGSSVAVTGVSLNTNSVTLTSGSTYQLSATISPSNASNQAVTWTSSNTSKVTVSSTGLLTAKATGSATITVKTVDGNKTATCAVTVQSSTISVTSVSVSPTTLSMEVGDTSTLTETVLPNNATNKSVTWTSSNTSVATVSNGGVTAVGVGSAIITVKTVDGNKTATCAVTVTAPSGVTTSIVTGTYATTNNWINGTKYTSIALDSVATASVGTGGDNTGKYYSAGPDWRFYQSESATLVISVINGYLLDSVTITYSSQNTGILLNSGGTTVESGVAQSVNGRNVTFSVGNSGSATNGQARITAISVTYHAAGDTTIHVTGVSVNPTTLTLEVNDTSTIVATVSPSDADNKDVEWESSDYDIVDVDSLGNVSALAEGAATVTVTTDDGSFTASCTITVIPSSAPSSGYSLTSGSPYMNNAPYKMYFTRSSTNYYFTGNIASSYYGGTTNSKHLGINVYFEQNGTGQNIYMIKDSIKYYFYVYINGNYINFKFDSTTVPSSKWTYSSTHSTMSYNISNTEYALGSTGTYPTIGAYKIANATYPIQFETTDDGGSTPFATILNEYITCNSAGTSAPTIRTGFTWTNFSEVYSHLDESSKSTIASATASPSGTEVQQFVARYDYIVGKYGYTDFLGRNPTPIASGRIAIFNDIISENKDIILVTLVSVLTALSIISFVFVHRKKEN